MLQSLRRCGQPRRAQALLLGYGGYGSGGQLLLPPWPHGRRVLCTDSPSSSSLARWLARGEAVSSGPIKWYACGPTVYDAAHLGHARTYVSQDVIRRVLEEHCGRAVFFVMGVTDVDDKIIARARATGEDPVALARRWEAEFWRDLRALNVRPPDAVARVTEHLDAIAAYIAGIERNGLAYRTPSSGVYFDVRAFARRFRYGKLGREANVQGEGDGDGAEGAAGGGGGGAVVGTVVGQAEKRDPRDFVLWKPAKDGEPSWPSPWGPGRPGWHIECSAITHRLLGDRVDIHSGGIDLKFPHHTNELAQCEAFLGAEDPPWVGTWLHTGHLYIEGLKMSKSLKNFVTVRACLDLDLDLDPEAQHPGPQQHFADDFRLFCCLRRFRANADYSEEAMAEARALRRVFLNFLALARHYRGAAAADGGSCNPSSRRWGPREFALQAELDKARAAVDAALRRDDVDTPEALRTLQALVGAGNRYLRQHGQGEGGGTGAIENVARYVERVLSLLGLTSHREAAGPTGSPGHASPQELAAVLVDFRARVRGAALSAVKDQDKSSAAAALPQQLLSLCDAVRDGELAALGLVLKDAQGGRPAAWSLEAKQQQPPQQSQQEPQQQQPPPSASSSSSSPAPPPPLATVGLQELFQQGPFAGQFSAVDASGIPTHDAAGQPISKRLRAKLEKKHEKHRQRLMEEAADDQQK